MNEKIAHPTEKIPEKIGSDAEKMSSFAEKIPKSSEKTDDILQNENTNNSTRKIGQRGKDKTRRKVNPKSIANLKQNSLKKEKRISSSQDIIDTKEIIISNPTITKEITNNPVTPKQYNTNFEDSPQKEDVDFESDDSEIINSSSSITTQGISAIVLLASFGRGAAIVVLIVVLGLLAYMLYKIWKQARDKQTEHDDEFGLYGQSS